MNKNYYQILDIDQSASYLEIRKKYLDLALKYHPDRNRHLPIDKYIENEEKFKLITIAFRTLADPVEREKYDKNKCGGYYYSYQNKNDNDSFTVSSVFLNLASKIFSEEKLQAGQDFYNTFTNFFMKTYKHTNTNPNPNINEFVVNFRKFIINKNLEREKETKCDVKYKENAPGKESENVKEMDREKEKQVDEPTKENNKEDNEIVINKPYIKKAKDLIYNVNVSLADIYNQVPKELNVARLRICDMCLGRGCMGFGENMSLCHICKGIMKVVDNKVFPIDIREKELIFKKEGNQSVVNEDPDNLIINIFSKPDDKFERIGDYDLLLNYKVNLIELYTKINISFEHLDNNKYLVRYKYQSQDSILNKMKLKVPNLGLPIGNNGKSGDLYIKLSVILPELSTPEINQLKMINSFNYDIDEKNDIDFDRLINL